MTRIVVVDDDPAVLDCYHRVLSRAGYTVRTESDPLRVLADRSIADAAQLPLRNFKKKTDYAEYGGAPLLGINGTCIIYHGRSSAKAIRNAIKVPSEFSRKRVYEVIAEEVNSLAVKGGIGAQG